MKETLFGNNVLKPIARSVGSLLIVAGLSAGSVEIINHNESPVAVEAPISTSASTQLESLGAESHSICPGEFHVYIGTVATPSFDELCF